MNAFNTTKSTCQTVRTSHRTLGAWNKYRSVRPQYMWVAVYCGI